MKKYQFVLWLVLMLFLEAQASIVLDGNTYLIVDGYKGPVGTQSRAFELQFKTDSQEIQTILEYGSSSNTATGKGYLVRIESGVLWLRTWNGRVASYNSPSGGYADGNWHELRIVQDANSILSEVSVFVDDNLLLGSVQNDGVLNTGQDIDFTIGASNYTSTSSPFIGMLGELKIWDGNVQGDNYTYYWPFVNDLNDVGGSASLSVVGNLLFSEDHPEIIIDDPNGVVTDPNMVTRQKHRIVKDDKEERKFILIMIRPDLIQQLYVLLNQFVIDNPDVFNNTTFYYFDSNEVVWWVESE